MIERAAILADGADFTAVMDWISAHDGEPETAGSRSEPRPPRRRASIRAAARPHAPRCASCCPPARSARDAPAYLVQIGCVPCASLARPALLVVFLCGALAALALAPAAGAAPLKARGSIKQAYVLGAKKGQRVVLKNAAGRTIAAGRADSFGSKIFRELKPGGGYRVRAGKRTSKRFKVLRPGANPRPAFYKRQKLKQGLNYVKMRDGVELAMTVRLPAGKTLDDGPFPTFIEYSGLPDRGAQQPVRLGGQAAHGGGAPRTRSRRRRAPRSAR